MTEYERGRAAGLAEAVKWHEEQIPRAKKIHDEAEKHFVLSGYVRGYGELMARATSTIAHHNEAIREIRALSPSPDHVLVPKPMAQERWTICEDCGKGIVEEDANWMDDGSSYCKSCRPRSSAMIAEVKT